MIKKTPFTRQGFDDLVAERNALKVSRIMAVANLKQARDMGDLSENAAYKVARSKLSSTDRRLRILDKILDSAYVIEPVFKGIVDIGCYVTVISKFGEQTFQIVNSQESNIAAGKLSYYSPVGQKLIGRKINEDVMVKTPNGNIIYKVKEIRINP